MHLPSLHGMPTVKTANVKTLTNVKTFEHLSAILIFVVSTPTIKGIECSHTLRVVFLIRRGRQLPIHCGDSECALAEKSMQTPTALC